MTNSTLVIVADCWEDVGTLLFDVFLHNGHLLEMPLFFGWWLIVSCWWLVVSGFLLVR
ncbi:hypothetical protein F7734_55455 [Scytonema sp. UIC 10036]|uniref:hypothetical protein n=1 Tax=Scytonema sp. UIC 10036 TaxID=2304196 RepID=UPI0012DAC00D|nr:hypothetical protein [Scytonema sp. UIC 10036]MUH00980.1 hypothetical protein [Scytonema sp. UIC 10036]